jgi:hypothetical protein
MATEGDLSKKPKRKGFTFGKFLLIVFLLAVVVITAMILRLPQKLGIIKSPTDQLLSGTLDRDSIKIIENELKNAGVSLNGVTVGVFPYKDGTGNLVAVILDSSQGFKQTSNDSESIVNYYFTFMAKNTKIKQLKVQRVVIDYKSERGKSLITVTAPIDVINNFISGKLNNEQFMKQTKGLVNFPELINQWKGMFK